MRISIERCWTSDPSRLEVVVLRLEDQRCLYRAVGHVRGGQKTDMRTSISKLSTSRG